MKFTSKRIANQLLSPGKYIAKIKEVGFTLAKSEGYKDRTQQIEVLFEVDGHGQTNKYIKEWYNIQAYKRYSELSDSEIESEDYGFQDDFVINKSNGCRVQDESKTAYVRNYFCSLGYASGIDEGTEFEIEDLLGRELEIVVGMNEIGRLGVIGFSKTWHDVSSNGDEYDLIEF